MQKTQTQTFTFWKDNRLDQQFTLTAEELQTKFLAWMKQRKKDWLEYYAFNLVRTFITAKDGLSSVFEESDYEKIELLLREIKWRYLNSIGIK